MEIEFKPTIRQHLAWKYLHDTKTNHILYGGSVGSGKSYIGCMWVFLSCIRWPGVRYLIGRSRLNNLKKTTLKTFIDICRNFNYNDYKINHSTSIIYFKNGSEVILSDLYPYPNDTDYDRLGSLEITGAFIDELSEISHKGFDVLSSRLRYKLDKYNITPKLFCASNPCQGWSKNYFYQPYKENRELDYVKFIPALPTDNPHLPKTYLETLNKTLDYALKQRLLYGNWNFDGDEYNLFNYEKLQQSFYNKNNFEEQETNKVYLTCDIADLGKDKTVLCVWFDWNCKKKYMLEKKETTQVVDKIRDIMLEYNIRIKNVIVDSVGVGAGVASLLKGCVRYMGNNKSINTGYKNIKTELMYKFAEKINNLECSFNFPYDDDLIQEALLYKKEFVGGMAGITGKDDIKQKLGRSPDTIDALYLRAYYEIKKVGGTKIRIM